jgi:hypothetical protein
LGEVNEIIRKFRGHRGLSMRLHQRDARLESADGSLPNRVLQHPSLITTTCRSSATSDGKNVRPASA